VSEEAEDNNPFRLVGELPALVDFVDELCVGVVPVQQPLHCNVSELTRGDNVTV